jgi:cell division protein FtsB
MKAELKGIVDGLHRYLSDVQQKTDEQRKNYDTLTREKAELTQCLRDLEADSKKFEAQKGELSLLREVVFELVVYHG